MFSHTPLHGRASLRLQRAALAVLLLLLISSPSGLAYSVLSHEALIDAAWDNSLKPLLLKRFPDASEDQLRQAHGFAYGGAIIQDLGYYPHGTHYFSDLLHYVRSGDFILTMLRESQDLNEYAFALGSLAHYVADNQGHRIAVNQAVPILYPKLRLKHGNTVTYEDDPAAHLKTEFGFDVLELARQRYAPEAYHKLIGFGVCTALLERAFEITYSVPLRSVVEDLDHLIGSYRWAVRTAIPKATKIAWELKKSEIEKEAPGATRKKFLYNLSRASFEKEWGENYDHPGASDKMLAFIIRIVPKIGALRALSFRTPTPETEKLFMASFNAALDNYRGLLRQFAQGNLRLPNDNFDTGGVAPPGTYFMQDNAYARLLGDLSKERFQNVSPSLRANLVGYFERFHLPARIPRDKKEKVRIDWDKVTQQFQELKSAQPVAEQAEAKVPE